MSDNEDNWFEKDIDELVGEVKKKVQIEVQTDTSGQDVDSKDLTSELHPVKPIFHLKQDFGGSYNVSSKERKSKSSTEDSRRLKKLIFISEQIPLSVFLEIYQPDSTFFECFEEKVSIDHIRPMIIAIAKFCELPFQEYGKDLLVKLLNSALMVAQIKDFLTGQNATTDIIQKFLNITWRIHYLGLKNEELLNLLDSIKLKYESNIAIKSELHSLLDALNGSFETYKEIYPSIDELVNNEPVELKLNIVNGTYSSVQEYISTQLSLLREDFIAPLREMIKDLKKFESVEKVSSPRVYKQTRFLLKDVFNTGAAKGVSLLVDLKPSERKNKVYVEILRMYNVNNIFNRSFLMLEPSVLLEPYRHVYGILRGLHEQNFPMKNFIVNFEQNSDTPDYLKGSKKYFKYDNHRFDPRVWDAYPPCEAMHLDQSQFSAFQNAMSRKFSLIHGPPGTGKTFLGLKIVSTILENVNARILIVCSTNHALDQFLSGILTSTKDVVRLGNQSKHGVLDRFNVKDRNLNDCFYNARGEYSKLMEEFERLRKASGEDSYEKVLEMQEKLQRASAKLDECRQIFKYKLIKCKRVVGMTTSYASRNNLLLSLLKIPIVIVVEAADVLESHLVATLTQSTEQLILIGEHKYFRPTTVISKLLRKYKKDIYLFERMISNELNCVCLNTQHRMRPEFTNLMRSTITYKDLRDAKNVQKYENIRGVAKNMFFVNHDFKETKSSDETTKRNPYEVGFLLALADYLVMQNYQPSDIVILAAYNGQMIEFTTTFRRMFWWWGGEGIYVHSVGVPLTFGLLTKHLTFRGGIEERKKYPRLEKVRIVVLDNFQGEESKIILLSLVRNNDENCIGYLAEKNRIGIALSRAREGFFVCGAINFLAENNSRWKKVRKTLEEEKSIGNSLPILCVRHGNVVEVQNVEDFQNVKSGRCCGC